MSISFSKFNFNYSFKYLGCLIFSPPLLTKKCFILISIPTISFLSPLVSLLFLVSKHSTVIEI
ncbi:hypothetical protein BBUCA112A_J0015 (plasmid) [Borreliella burgdorferi CA-11.2A]|nr:hypothetical protein BBUCA112A_J0015 [Borreliella burgdorferi CA-11.2A]